MPDWGQIYRLAETMVQKSEGNQLSKVRKGAERAELPASNLSDFSCSMWKKGVFFLHKISNLSGLIVCLAVLAHR